MINFKDDLNAELNNINCRASSKEIISKAKSPKKPSYYIPRIVAAVLVIAVIAGGIILAPAFLEEPAKRSFTVYAGAAEVSDKEFVVINSDDTNFVNFDFNHILDADADPTDITKKYLFYSFEKRFNLKITGENIDGFIFIANNCFLERYKLTPYINAEGYGLSGDCSYGLNGELKNVISCSYYDQNDWTYSINPTGPVSELTRMSLELTPLEPYIALAGTGEIITDEDFGMYHPDNLHVDAEALGYDPIAYGVKSSDESVVTEAEADKLREYIDADDMTGFYNYQNQIFKRLIDNISVDILIRKNDQSKYYYETARLQFCYNPTEVTAEDVASENHSETLSKGTLSAKLVDMPEEREEELLSKYNNQ